MTFRKTLDLSKFRKDVTKSIDGVSTGFESDPEAWVSTGNHTLNYLISGDFHRGVPLGRVTMFSGFSGSGKSYICSGNMVKDAQEKDIFVVLVDTENALDEEWLHRLGVDTSPEKLEKVNITMIDDLSKYVSMFMKDYRESYKNTPLADQPPVLFVVDSLGALQSKAAFEQAEAGTLKGDMGHKAKGLKQFITYANSQMMNYNVGMVATNHVYESQDMYNPDPKISGGSGFIFMASIIVVMNKGKLKEDEDGNKTSEVNGVRSMCRVEKTRFNHKGLQKKVEIKIPFDKGMDAYSGLFDFAVDQGILLKEGNRYAFIDKNGKEVFKEFRKNITHEQFDLMMKDFSDLMELKNHVPDEVPEGDEE